MPSISIIIPVYNTNINFLNECMDSITSQTFEDYEVILVDDGSANGVGMACDQYARRNSRFRVIHQKNRGVSAARNAGTDIAVGKWIIYVDPDDWLEEKTLELLYSKIEKKDPDILIFGRFDNFSDCQKEQRYFSQRKGICRTAAPKLIRNMQLGIMNEYIRRVAGYNGSPCMQIVKRDFINNGSLRFNEKIKIMEDGIYNLYLLEKAEHVVIWDIPLYHYRQHRKSVTKRYNPETTEDFVHTFRELYKFVRMHREDGDFYRAYEIALMRGYLRILQKDIFDPGNDMPDRKKRRKWLHIIQTTDFFRQLEKADFVMLYKCRKYYGCMYFLTFRFKSYYLLKWSFKAGSFLKKV